MGGSPLAQWKWKAPAPPGQGAAIDTMTGVAAPLLAGFSLTLIGVICQDPSHIRWPGTTLVALVIAISLFIACVQFGFHARARLYTSADIKDWRPDFYAKHAEVLANQQRLHWKEWEDWAGRASVTYNLAICVLTFGVALIVAPRDGYREATLRWTASALLLAAGVGEMAWIATDHPRLYAWIPDFFGSLYARIRDFFKSLYTWISGFFSRHLRFRQSPKRVDQDVGADTSESTIDGKGAGDA